MDHHLRLILDMANKNRVWIINPQERAVEASIRGRPWMTPDSSLS